MTDATISNLRDRSEFAETVADRVWNAWWREQGVERATLVAMVEETLAAETIPTALVAHDGETFLGTAHLIESDLEERPQLTPWVAALWVEPPARGSGLGARLTLAMAQAGFDAGFDRVYLCAEPRLRPFYAAMGWRLMEEDVAGLDVFALDRSD